MQTAQIDLFIFLAAVAVGTIAGGPLGDRIGVKYVIWGSILGVLPFTLALPHASLFWTPVLTVAIGLVLASAFSAIVVYAQELVPGRVGLISGVFFGFAFGIAGIGAAVLGRLADAVGIEAVYRLCAFLPAIGILTAFLPDLDDADTLSATPHESPELGFVEQRDPVPLLAQPLDLHQLQPAIAARRPAAGWAGRARRRSSCDDGEPCTMAPARVAAFAASVRALAQDPGERQVHALERSEHAGTQRRRRVLQRVDQLVRALVALAALADAAIDDLLQVIAAREPAHVGRPDARSGIALHEHRQRAGRPGRRRRAPAISAPRPRESRSARSARSSCAR